MIAKIASKRENQFFSKIIRIAFEDFKEAARLYYKARAFYPQKTDKGYLRSVFFVEFYYTDKSSQYFLDVVLAQKVLMMNSLN